MTVNVINFLTSLKPHSSGERKRQTSSKTLFEETEAFLVTELEVREVHKQTELIENKRQRNFF